MKGISLGILFLLVLFGCKQPIMYYKDIDLQNMEGIGPISELEEKSYPYIEIENVNDTTKVIKVWNIDKYSNQYSVRHRFNKVCDSIWLKTYSYKEGFREYFGYDYILKNKITSLLYVNNLREDSIAYLFKMYEKDEKGVKTYQYLTHESERKISPAPDHNINRINSMFPCVDFEFFKYKTQGDTLIESFYSGNWNSDTSKLQFNYCYSLRQKEFKHKILSSKYFNLLKELNCNALDAHGNSK